MKTLKRTLCLVLALVMVLGFVAFSASAAAVTDLDAVGADYVEAVTVMNGLKAIVGDENGAFNPKATLTRAEAATIITRIMGAEGLKGVPSFTDAKNHWSASYIAFCESEGILVGNGDGTVSPDAKLTGSAWAIMMLRAMGYDDATEGFVGEMWEVNVAKKLKSVLAAKTYIKGSEEIDREEAAKLAFDLMQKPTMEFKEGIQIQGTDLTVSAGGSYTEGASLMNTTYGAAKETSKYIITALKTLKDSKKNEYAAFTAKPVVAPSEVMTVDFVLGNCSIDKEMIGHTVTLWTVPTKAKVSATLETVGIIDNTKVVTVAKATDKLTLSKLNELLGTNYAAVPESSATVNTVANYVVTGTATPFTKNADGTVKVAKGEYLVVNNALTFVKTEASDAKLLTVTYSKATKSVPAYVTVKDGDTVLFCDKKDAEVNKIYGEAPVDFASLVSEKTPSKSVVMIETAVADEFALEAVKTVTGTVSVKASGSLTVDGKKYTVLRDPALDNGVKSKTANIVEPASTKIGSEYTLYLDEAGKVFAVTSEAAAVDYTLMYVIGMATKTTAGEYSSDAGNVKYYAQYYNLEGAVDVVEVAYIGETKIADCYNAETSGWYVLSVNSAGKNVLTALSGTAVGGYKLATITTSANTDMSKATTLGEKTNLLTEDTVVLFSQSTKFNTKNKAATVYTGKFSGSLKAASYQAVVKTNATNSAYSNVVAVWVGGETAATIVGKDVYYVKSFVGQVSEANTTTGVKATYRYELINIDGEVETLDVTNNDFASGFATLETVGDYTTLVNADAKVIGSTTAKAVGAVDVTLAYESEKLVGYFALNGENYVTAGAKDYNVTSAVFVDLVNTAPGAVKAESLSELDAAARLYLVLADASKTDVALILYVPAAE